MKLEILGGAGEYGRSCYLLEHDGNALLLDCGVKRIHSGNRIGEYPLIEPRHAQQIRFVLLSHAHEDHCAALPLLYEQGFRGKVYCSDRTAAQARRLLESWKETTGRYGGTLPYTDEAIKQVEFAPLAELPEAAASAKLAVTSGRAGHVPGSVWFHLHWAGETFFFSGDYNLSSRLYAYDMPGPADTVILDAAYGHDAKTRETYEDELLARLLQVIGNKGKALLPLPLVGRGQEMIALLLTRSAIHRQLCDISWVIEAAIWDKFAEMLDDDYWCYPIAGWEKARTGAIPWIRIVSTEAERLSAIEAGKPQLILTTDGMMNNSLASFWLSVVGADAENAIVLTGYQAPGTVGEQVLQGRLPIAAQAVNLRCKVHPNLPEIIRMVEALQAKRVILVHQQRELLLEAADEVRKKGVEAHLLSAGDRFNF